MIHLKTTEEIAIMTECGKRLMKAVDELLPFIKEGVSTLEIDEKAEKLLIKQGTESSFKKVKGYEWSTCTAINEQTVHTPPTQRRLEKGDVFTLDMGAYYQGFHTDWATTMVIGGETTPEIQQFLDVGKSTLENALKVIKPGAYLGEISEIMEKGIYGNGYFVLKDLTGHGVGRDLHEDPFVLNYLDRPVKKTYKIQPGLVIAVEIIYSMGTEEIAYEKGLEWSIVTSDGSLSACFEKTIAITEKNAHILT